MSHCLTSLMPWFITPLPRIGITSKCIYLLANKSTATDFWRIRNCAGAIMDTMVRQTVEFMMLWRWRTWKTFQIMITWKQSGLISTHKMTLGVTQIFSFYVPVFTSVWLTGVMKNVSLGQQTSAFHQDFFSGIWRCEELVEKVHSCWFSFILHGNKNEKEREKWFMSLWQFSSTYTALSLPMLQPV